MCAFLSEGFDGYLRHREGERFFIVYGRGGGPLFADAAEVAAMALHAPQQSMQAQVMRYAKETEIHEVQSTASNVGGKGRSAREHRGDLEEHGVTKPHTTLGRRAKTGKESNTQVKQRIERRIESSRQAQQDHHAAKHRKTESLPSFKGRFFAAFKPEANDATVEFPREPTHKDPHHRENEFDAWRGLIKGSR